MENTQPLNEKYRWTHKPCIAAADNGAVLNTLRLMFSKYHQTSKDVLGVLDIHYYICCQSICCFTLHEALHKGGRKVPQLFKMCLDSGQQVLELFVKHDFKKDNKICFFWLALAWRLLTVTLVYNIDMMLIIKCFQVSFQNVIYLCLIK